MVDNVAELTARAARGERFKYLYFWGHRPQRDGGVGKGCLSQWWPAPFTADGIPYPTAEHWMMASKARLFQDADAERRVLASRHPREAKSVGRTVRGFDETVWERERYTVVVEGCIRKFGQHGALREYLLGTNNRVLAEASPLDRVWGIGLAADDERVRDPAQWRGLNLLGFALMEARSRLLSHAGVPVGSMTGDGARPGDGRRFPAAEPCPGDARPAGGRSAGGQSAGGAQSYDARSAFSTAARAADRSSPSRRTRRT